ncbi:hypothetical protein BH23CHL8_BH23CHL8_29850 [soil metagenome]
MRWMPLTIDLLGTPAVAVGGRAVGPPRGRKAWGLLAYLLLASVPPTRERLASLLFPEAADPLGAVRWNLAELRRLLGPSVELGGEPVRLTLPPDAVVDVQVLVRASWVEATRVPGLGHELLEGVELRDSAAFEMWLLAERRRYAGIAASILREAATARLASGDPHSAIELAARLVAIEEFDEEAHALLVRAYVAAGDAPRARLQLTSSLGRLRRDLGMEPSAALLHALDYVALSPPSVSVGSGPTAIVALIDAGRAAVCRRSSNPLPGRDGVQVTP